MRLGTIWRKGRAPAQAAAPDHAPACDAEARYDALVASLQERTGRDLASWIALIARAEFQDKNEVIDFLRARGFIFAEASMLELTHALGHSPFDVTRRRQPERLAKQRGRDSVVTVRKVAVHARDHALALLAHLQLGRAGEEVLPRDCEVAYGDLCQRLGWQPVRWKHKNGVGHHLRQLTGGAKPYRDVITNGAKRQRLCVYAIPEPAPVHRIRRRDVAANANRMAQPMRAAVAA